MSRMDSTGWLASAIKRGSKGCMVMASWAAAAGPLGDAALAARCAWRARCCCAPLLLRRRMDGAAPHFSPLTAAQTLHTHSHTHSPYSGEITDGDRAVLSLKAQRRKLEDQAKLVRAG